MDQARYRKKGRSCRMIYLEALEKRRAGSGYPWSTEVLRENTVFALSSL